jgi:hypothetical protein
MSATAILLAGWLVVPWVVVAPEGCALLQRSWFRRRAPH